jgi:hypothetical protein
MQTIKLVYLLESIKAAIEPIFWNFDFKSAVLHYANTLSRFEINLRFFLSCRASKLYFLEPESLAVRFFAGKIKCVSAYFQKKI